MASTTVITPTTQSKIGPTRSEPAPVPKPVMCRACGDMGWWCRGCGGGDKIDGMIAVGITNDEADDIYHEQFAGCDKPFVPCYVCNRLGHRSPPEGFAVRRKFWWTEADHDTHTSRTARTAQTAQTAQDSQVTGTSH